MTVDIAKAAPLTTGKKVHVGRTHPGQWIALPLPADPDDPTGLTVKIDNNTRPGLAPVRVTPGTYPARVVHTLVGPDSMLLVTVKIDLGRRGELYWQLAAHPSQRWTVLPSHHAVCRKCGQLAPCFDDRVAHHFDERYNQAAESAETDVDSLDPDDSDESDE